MKEPQEIIEEQRRIILEMINTSWEPAMGLGRHPLTKGCNCIVCINKRKRILNHSKGEWKFSL